MNLDLIYLYLWPFLASLSFGVLLTLVGMQFAARDKSVQVLVVSQGSIVGILVGLALALTFDVREFEAAAVFVGSLLAVAVVFKWTNRILVAQKSARSVDLIATYVGLIAAGYLITALVPALENHLSQKFLGDLVTVSNEEAQIGVVLSIFMLVFVAACWSRITQQSFDETTLGLAPRWRSLAQGFTLVSFITIAYAIMLFGLTFTLATMFVGTSMAAAVRGVGLKRHTLVAVAITIVGNVIGFVVSMLHPRLSTVPTMVLCMIALGALYCVINRITSNA
jgi:zinc/manganese transport system permease protein